MCGLAPASLALNCAASSLSAGVPCLSPRASFRNAYWTTMERLAKNWPFMASTAASEASKQSYDTKANPFETPVSGSRMTLGESMMTPKAANVS